MTSGTPSKWVYDFSEGNKDQKDLLGGKGANLAEMTNLGLPVPPGFTITTDACRYYLEHGGTPPELDAAGHRAPAARSRRPWARRWATRRTRCWSRSARGPRRRMPGMMETVLNVGLNDESVQGLAEQSGNERFAWDSYRRLIQMFGKTVLDIDGEPVRARPRRGQARAGHRARPRPRRRAPQGRRRAASRPSCGSRPAATSRWTRASRWTSRSTPSSTRGTPSGRSSTAAGSASRATPAPPSTSARWCSATWARTPAPASPSPATRAAARRASTATTCRTPRARTSSPASATPCRWPTSRTSTRTPTTS